MHIERARVMNYKCIEDSGWVDFEEDLTRFVGANEAGKTSFLEAVADYNEQSNVPDEKLCKYCSYDESVHGVPISAIELNMNPVFASEKIKKEKPIFRHISKRNIVVRYSTGEIELRRRFDPRDQTAKDKIDFIDRFSHSTELKQIHDIINIDMISYFKEFKDYDIFLDRFRVLLDDKVIIKGSEDKLPMTEKTGVSDQILCAEILRRISRDPSNIRMSHKLIDIEINNIPKIKLYKNINKIEESICRKELGSEGHSPFYPLFKETEKENNLTHTPSKRRAIETDFTSMINNNWPNIQLELRIVEIDDLMSIEISRENNKQVVTIPSERSEGFRWFLSFCIEVLFSDTEEDILLLDDPGGALHPEANKKVRDALENFAEDTQTAYSTHSPYMLDTSDLDSIRLVQRENSETTEIVNDLSEVETDSPDALAPVRARLGAKHADSLFASKQNIIVEGFTDRKYLEAFSEFLGDGEPVLPDQLSITDASGGGNIETLAKMVIAEGYDYAILLDDDRGGRSSKENLLDAGIAEENIVMVSDAHDDEESSNDTVEDLLDDDVAIEALAQMHDSFGEDDLRGEIDGREHFPKRVIDRLKELDGTGELDDSPTEVERLAKGGMAEYVTRKIETGQWDESEIGAETVERFDTLLDEVLAVLESDDE